MLTYSLLIAYKIFAEEDSKSAIMILSQKGQLSVLTENPSAAKVAEASFTDKLQENGLTYLSVISNPAYQDTLQAYSAGYLEGYLTKDLINSTMYNLQTEVDAGRDVRQFIDENYEYLKKNANSRIKDTYWYQVRLLLFQIKGLEDAFASRVPVLSNDVDKLNSIWMLHWRAPEINDVHRKFDSNFSGDLFMSASCTALIKNVDNDLIVAHSTWSDYNMMLRIIKKYVLPFRISHLHRSVIPGSIVLQSSYPGVLHSVDDYYVTNQHLVITETTNKVYNHRHFKSIQPHNSVPYFLRVLVANRLSPSGKDWARTFSKLNSGTYNNQWMIVDYKMFSPHTGINMGTLLVLEQLPGSVVYKDMSEVLQTGNKFWASYNLPYFQETKDAVNLSAMITEYGLYYSHEMSPRANIFNRDVPNVTDVNSTIYLMRYNDFENDPFAEANCFPLGYSAENAIASRGDLNPLNASCKIEAEGPRCHGATDVKVVDMQMANDLNMMTVIGPTHQGQPVFDWTEQTNTKCKNHRHLGQPDRFDFNPVKVVMP